MAEVEGKAPDKVEAWPVDMDSSLKYVEEDNSSFYSFCDSTSFHGLDLVREQASRCRNIVWISVAFVGLVVVSYFTGSLVKGYHEQRTGVNQILLETPPPLPSIKICYDTWLPERLDEYPPPTPVHVVELLRERDVLGGLLAYSSGLWRKSLAKAKQISAQQEGSAASEEAQFAADVYSLVRPEEEEMGSRSAYEALLRAANASSFAELILKLSPHPRYPLALLNGAPQRQHWTTKTYLLANRKQICQHFIAKQEAEPDKLELLLIFPPIFAKTKDVILGDVGFEIRDYQGVLIHRLSRPLGYPPSARELDANSAAYEVAQGREAKSSLQPQLDSLMRADIRLASRTYAFLKRRKFPCVAGREPDPVLRDLDAARRPRPLNNKTCTPMDEAFLDTEEPESWSDICEPWELRALEEAYLRANADAGAEAVPAPSTVAPTTARPKLPLEPLPLDLVPPVFNFTRDLRQPAVALSAELRAAYQAWIRRTEGNRTGPNFCEAASYSVADATLTYEDFYAKSGLFGAAFREAAVRAHYEEALRHSYDAFAQPQLPYTTLFRSSPNPAKETLTQVRLSMRELRGDHVLVEQFLLVDLGILFSQLGGFIGLFIGGSVISILHLGSFVIEAGVSRSNYRRKLASVRFNTKVIATPPGAIQKASSIELKTALLCTAGVGVVLVSLCLVLALNWGSDSSPAPKTPSNFNRTAFFSFPRASSDQLELRSCGAKFLFVRPDWLASEDSVMTSPGFPRKYPESLTCRYTLVARPFSLPIRLSFTHFNVEPNYDRLSLLDKADGGGRRVVANCSGTGLEGLRCASSLVPLGGELWELEFVSDATDTLQGFRARASLSLASCAAAKQAEVLERNCSQADFACYHSWRHAAGEAGFRACTRLIGSRVFREQLCLAALLGSDEGLSWEDSLCACANRGGTLLAPVPSLNFTEEAMVNLLLSSRQRFQSSGLWLGASKRIETLNLTSWDTVSSDFSWHSFGEDVDNRIPLGQDGDYVVSRNCIKFDAADVDGNEKLVASGCGVGVRLRRPTFPFCMFLRAETDGQHPTDLPTQPPAEQPYDPDPQTYEWRLPTQPIPASACGPQEPGTIRIPVDEVHSSYAPNMNCTWKLEPKGGPLAIFRASFVSRELEPYYDGIILRNRTGHVVRLCLQSRACDDVEAIGSHTLQFISDQSELSGGFRFSYSFEERPGGEVVARFPGVLQGFPGQAAMEREAELGGGVWAQTNRSGISEEDCAAWCAHNPRCTVASVAQGSRLCRLQYMPQPLALLSTLSLQPGVSLVPDIPLRNFRPGLAQHISKACATLVDGLEGRTYSFHYDAAQIHYLRIGDVCYAPLAELVSWDSAHYACQALFGEPSLGPVDPSSASDWAKLVNFLQSKLPDIDGFPKDWDFANDGLPDDSDWNRNDSANLSVWVGGFGGAEGWLWLRNVDFVQAADHSALLRAGQPAGLEGSEWDGGMGEGPAVAAEAGSCVSLHVRPGPARLVVHPQGDCIDGHRTRPLC